MLPNDIHMLVSILNMKLRDDDMSLENLLDINDLNEHDFFERVEKNDYYYDAQINQIKQK